MGGGVGVVIVMVDVVTVMVGVAGEINLIAPLEYWTGGVTVPLVTSRTVPLLGKWMKKGSRWSQGSADYK